MRFLLPLTALFVLVWAPATLGTSLGHQLQTFLAAEDALREGRRDKFTTYSAELTTHPLYPYLVYEDLRRNISLKQEERILSFLEAYPGTPLSHRLSSLWLGYLARNKEWHKLARDFREPADPSVHCAYAHALIETNQYAKAWEEAENLWLHAHSRPVECDPVFNGWRKAGGLTTGLIWERIILSMTLGETRLAGYLKRYLPPDDRLWADLWIAVIGNPERTLTIDWSAANHPVAEKILHQGMSGLIRKNTHSALARWEALSAIHDLERFDTNPIEQEIGLYLSLRKHPEALAYLDRLPPERMTPSLRWWQIRAAIYQQDWEAVLRGWQHLDDPDKESPRWTYWYARALEKQGRHSEAADAYRRITGRQNYFSLLAADRLNIHYHLEHHPITVANRDMRALKQDPGIRRAIALSHLGRITEARREWHHAMSGKDARMNNAAALLAHRMGWHDRAVIAAANAGSYNDLDVRFPLAYGVLIQNYARERNLDPGWLFALARQESLFVPDVRSHAGAIGVMQIMPSTGRRVAAMMGERFPNTQVLLLPETNIRIGTYYLKNRLEQFQGNPVPATAAYNAGLHRVNSWLPEGTAIPPDVWIETIPFFETRDYVEKIFTYKVIYEQRLGKTPQRLVSMMADVSGMPVITAEKAP